MSRRLRIGIVALSVGTSLSWAAVSSDPLERAETFLASLDGDQRASATWAWEDEERVDVHYAPIGLDGLRHGDLDRDVHAIGESLLGSVLSADGFAKVRAIRLLERDVGAQEGALRRLVAGGLRDPGRYFFAFFGEPSAVAPWALRYEGHHLSLNVTLLPGKAPATTPLFLGAQPRVVPEGLPSAGVAALGEEERIARALYAALDGEARASATLPYADDRGHMIGQVARPPASAPIGLPRSRMNAQQQAMLDALLDRFARLWRDDIASERRAEMAAARAGLHFAHVESSTPANAFCTRISGPGLLIEIDNTEGGDHLHAVWHRPGADFGDDLLARHWREEHGVKLARAGRH